MNNHHYLKIEKPHFQNVKLNIRRFEIRNNDHNFKVGDKVHFEESENGTRTGATLPPVELKYVFHGPRYGLLDGFCVFNW